MTELGASTPGYSNLPLEAFLLQRHGHRLHFGEPQPAEHPALQPSDNVTKSPRRHCPCRSPSPPGEGSGSCDSAGRAGAGGLRPPPELPTASVTHAGPSPRRPARSLSPGTNLQPEQDSQNRNLQPALPALPVSLPASAGRGGGVAMGGVLSPRPRLLPHCTPGWCHPSHPLFSPFSLPSIDGFSLSLSLLLLHLKVFKE